jgi:ubiquinone/menaquinone biosynthesis C-methylase UbiE
MSSQHKEWSPEEILQLEDPYFELQAYVGTTKHMGGLKSTRELIKLCQVEKGTYVLDVGCGAGATPSYLAKEVGCRVMAVDIRASMLALAAQRVQRDGVAELVELKVADAQHLPFEDGLFGAVLVESVTSFIPDKQRAVSEFARVTRAGGSVGLNEDTWLKVDPPDEFVTYAAHTWGGTQAETSDGWKGLLEAAGLRDVVAKTFTLKAGREASQVQRYSMGDMWRMVSRSLRMYLNPAFRRYMKERTAMPKGLWEYLGYGLYVGRKQA